MECEDYMSARYHSGRPRQVPNGSISVLVRPNLCVMGVAVSDPTGGWPRTVARQLARELPRHHNGRLVGVPVISFAPPHFGKAMFPVEGDPCRVRLANL